MMVRFEFVVIQGAEILCIFVATIKGETPNFLIDISTAVLFSIIGVKILRLAILEYYLRMMRLLLLHLSRCRALLYNMGHFPRSCCCVTVRSVTWLLQDSLFWNFALKEHCDSSAALFRGTCQQQSLFVLGGGGGGSVILQLQKTTLQIVRSIF